MLDFLQFPYSETQFQSVVSKGYNTFKRNHSLDGDFEHFTPAQRLFVNSLVRTTNTKLEEHGLADKYNLTTYLSHWFYHIDSITLYMKLFYEFSQYCKSFVHQIQRQNAVHNILCQSILMLSKQWYLCNILMDNHIVDFIHRWWLWSHSVFSVLSLQSIWGSRGWEFPYLNFFSHRPKTCSNVKRRSFLSKCIEFCVMHACINLATIFTKRNISSYRSTGVFFA